MPFSVIQNEKTGEYGLWDGNQISPMPGPVVPHEKTGMKAVLVDKTLIPLDSIGSWMDQKRAIERMTDMDPGDLSIAAALEKGKAQVAARPKSIGEAAVSGVLGIPRAIASMVTEPVRIFNELHNRSPEELAAQRTRLQRGAFSSLKDTFTSPEAQGFAEGAANALTAGTLSSLLPPPVTKGQKDMRDLGGLVGLAPAFGASRKVVGAVAPKVLPSFLAGPVSQTAITAGGLSAAGPLAQGDIPGAVEHGISTAASAAILHGVQSAVGSAAQRYAQNRQAEALGTDEILSAAARRLAKPNVDAAPLGGVDVPPTIGEAGSTIQRAYHGARNAVKAKVNDLNNVAEQLTPQNVTRKSDAIAMMVDVGEGTAKPLLTAAEKKLASAGREMSPAPGQAVPKTWADALSNQVSEKFKINLAGQSPETQAQIKEAVKLSQPATKTGEMSLSDLYALRRRVNAITPKPGTPDSFVLGSIKKVIDIDIEKFRPEIPRAVEAWKAADRYYENEYAPYFKQGGNIRSAIGEPEGRRFDQLEQTPGAGRVGQFDKAGSLVIDDLLRLPIEDLRRFRHSMTRPSGETLSSGAVPRGEGATFENIRSAITQKMIDYSINPETGRFSPADFANRVRGGGPERAAKYRLLMGDEGYNNLTKFVREIEKAGLGSYAGNEQYALKKGSHEAPAAVEFGEIYHLTTGAAQIARGSPMGYYHVGQAGTMAIARPLFNKIIGNSAGRKLLAAGLVEPVGTPRAAMIQDRLGRIVEKNAAIAEREAEKYKGPPQFPPGLPPPPIITPPPSGGPAPSSAASSTAQAGPPAPSMFVDRRGRSGQVNPVIFSDEDLIIANLPHETTDNLRALARDSSQPSSIRRAAADVLRRR